MNTTSTILSIAGTDPSGGAGIQVDLQVFRDLGHHGASVITAVVWQNTQTVHGWHAPGAEVLDQQLSVLLDDVSPAAVKIGMLTSPEDVRVVAKHIKQLDVPIVHDPVMASGDGSTALLVDRTLDAMRAELFEHVTVLTPNIPEAEVLCGEAISESRLTDAATMLRERTGAQHVLLKVGHLSTLGESLRDVWADEDDATWLEPLPVLPIDNVRGTGCQLSSAIAAGLASGQPPKDATERARRYLWDLLRRRRRRVGEGRAVITRAGA